MDYVALYQSAARVEIGWSCNTEERQGGGGLEAKEAVGFDKVFPIQGSNGGVTLREEEEALEGRGGADCPAIGRGLKTGTGAWSPGRHPGLEPGH